MIGFSKKSQNDSQQEAYQEAQIKARPQPSVGQIPYEVYETIHEPAARRQRWAVRIVAVLLATTLLVFGGLALRDKLKDGNTHPVRPGNTTSQTKNPASGNNSASQQTPQTNAPLQKPGSDPAIIPQSDSTNNGTVSQPE